MKAEQENYDQWAWLYDQTMGPEYGQEKWKALQKMILPKLPDGAKLLDLCCGTGPLIPPLIQSGYQVTGLDASNEMLAFARKKAPEADFVHEDARHFQLKERFDGVISTSASLNHMPTLQDLEQVFAQVYASLRTGGLFLFDLNHPQQMQKWWRGTPTEGDIHEHCAWMVTPRYDVAKKQGAFQVTLFRRPASSGVTLRERLQRPFYNLLRRSRFIGLRLKLIQQFHLAEPRWARSDIDFPVIGFDLDLVIEAVSKAGFCKIQVQTIDQQLTVDADHSAYFSCERSDV